MLILVRHGRTEANASGLLLGRMDPPLDPTGVAQATAVAEALAGAGVDRIVTSPLDRTRSTATAIAGRTGAVVEVDERWIELDYGELDGQALKDVPLSLWQAWQADVTFRPPSGESLVELGARVRESLEDLAAAAASSTVVVVSHVSPIKAAVAWALGVGDDVAWRVFLSPASITRISCSGRAPSMHSFNETAHLPA